MESSSANPLRAVISQNNSATSASPAIKKGRFGLPPDPSLSAKINNTGLQAPATNIKENGRPINFNGQQLPQNKETAQIFAKHIAPQEEPKNHRSGDLIINGKKTETLNGKLFIAPTEQTTQVRETRFTNIQSSIKNGQANIAFVDHNKKTIEFSKLDKKVDITQIKNGFILANNNVVPLNTDSHPTDFTNYQFIAKDKSLEKDLQTIKQNFINGNVFIATSAELKILNDINQNRTQETKSEVKKQDNPVPQDVKQKTESNIQNTVEQPKVKEEASKKERVTERENIKSSFVVDEQKTAKAHQLKRNEELREEKQESTHEIDKKNQENIDARVLNRIKKKIKFKVI